MMDSRPKLLFLDKATCHSDTAITNEFAKPNTFLQFIPGGETSTLQFVDTHANRMWKAIYGRKYDAAMFADPQKRSAKEKHIQMTVWVKESLDEMYRKMDVQRLYWDMQVEFFLAPLYRGWKTKKKFGAIV